MFSYFRGELKNVSNTGDIRYSNDPGPPAKLQTVFMYINNIEVKLTQENATGPVTRFMLDTSDSSNLDKAFDAIFKGGENVVKFVFLTPNNSYVSETKFVIIPTNLPEIPAKNTDGVFPYSVNRTEPMKNDPNFELRGTVYTTREARMNIFGTFDFIDLGNTASLVESELSLLGSNAQNYILHIQTGDEVYEWNLGQEFQGKDGAVFNANLGNSPISVAYDYEQGIFRIHPGEPGRTAGRKPEGLYDHGVQQRQERPAGNVPSGDRPDDDTVHDSRSGIRETDDQSKLRRSADLLRRRAIGGD